MRVFFSLAQHVSLWNQRGVNAVFKVGGILLNKGEDGGANSQQ